MSSRREDAAIQEAANEKLKKERKRMSRLVNNVFLTSSDGRELLMELLTILDKEPFSGNSQTYFTLGRQHMARVLREHAKQANIAKLHEAELNYYNRNKEAE